MPRNALLLALLLVACAEGRDRTPSNPSGTPPVTNTPCGNGALEGVEACDGTAFVGANTCETLGLGGGTLGCSTTCTLDPMTCDFTDYCTANNLYGNGQCDPCDRLGGVRDPDCTMACSADGMCGDRFDPLIGNFVCRAAGMIDPDCGQCGNGIVEGPELCDRQTFPMGTHRCEDWGYLDGTLGCKGDCTPNFGECRSPVCGDGRIEGAEQCDGSDLAGASCESIGFAGGALGCATNCQYEVASCVDPGCGNGIVEPAEACEQGQVADTCESLGFAGGTVACSGTCELETAGCVSPGCGNGIIETPIEECEGADLGGATCVSRGFAGGTLTCSTTSCTLDTSNCVAPGCGNDIIEPSEDCEGPNLGSATCQSLGFVAGTLTCSDMCAFDTSQCVMGGCGNNLIEAGEACDGTNLRGESCFSLTRGVGQLRCVGCQYDMTSCRNTCGDGAVNSNEACDGTRFRNNASSNCADLGLGAGTVRCSVDCTLDLSGCAMDACTANGWYNDGACDPCHTWGGNVDPDCAGCTMNGTCVDFFSGLAGRNACNAYDPTIRIDPDCTCNNGTLDQGETCDGSNFFSTAISMCDYYGFTSGTVACTPACEPDPSLCQ